MLVVEANMWSVSDINIDFIALENDNTEGIEANTCGNDRSVTNTCELFKWKDNEIFISYEYTFDDSTSALK